MLSVTSITGNIFADRRLATKYRRVKATYNYERLLVSRMELERLRLRRTTDKGTDVGIILEPGNRLHHGDVLPGEKFIVIEQLPEKVVSITLRNDNSDKMISLAALIGHTIGNRHKPIAVSRSTISFPIQAESEVDMFNKLLPSSVRMKIAEEVFLPAGEVHSHE